MSSYLHRESHCGDKTVVRSSCLHNGMGIPILIRRHVCIEPRPHPTPEIPIHVFVPYYDMLKLCYLKAVRRLTVSTVSKPRDKGLNWSHCSEIPDRDDYAILNPVASRHNEILRFVSHYYNVQHFTCVCFISGFLFGDDIVYFGTDNVIVNSVTAFSAIMWANDEEMSWPTSQIPARWLCALQSRGAIHHSFNQGRQPY